MLIFGIYIVIVEIFMPSRLAGWMGFYVTWAGKGLFFIFIGVLLILPYQAGVNPEVYYLIAAIYLFVVAVILIVLQILAAVSVHSRSSSHSIIVVKSSSSSSLHTTLASSASSA